MVIIKFALFFFLITLIWLVTIRQSLGTPYGGPFYYADVEGTSNPVQPKYKLNFKQAWNSDRYVAVYFDENGNPLLAQHYVRQQVGGRMVHQLGYQMVWIWTKQGRLSRRYVEDPAGKLLQIDVLPTPEPSLTPAP
jgi:hypothetical protein